MTILSVPARRCCRSLALLPFDGVDKAREGVDDNDDDEEAPPLFLLSKLFPESFDASVRKERLLIVAAGAAVAVSLPAVPLLPFRYCLKRGIDAIDFDANDQSESFHCYCCRNQCLLMNSSESIKIARHHHR